MIIANKNFSTYEQPLIMLIVKLSKKDEITEKISCINLISLIFPKIVSSENKTTCFEILQSYIDEISELPLIKIEAAMELQKIMPYLNENQIKQIITSLLNDQNDSIRIYITKAFTKMNNTIDNKIKKFITQTAIKQAEDESWRVRYATAENLAEIMEIVKGEKYSKSLIEAYCKLMEDEEKEVKNICCKKMEDISKAVGKDDNFVLFLEKLKPFVDSQQKDFILQSFSQNILKISPHIKTEDVTEYVYPIFDTLMKKNVHEIQMSLFKTLNHLKNFVDIDTIISELIPSIMYVFNNNNWRIRLECSDFVPVISKVITKQKFLDLVVNLCLDRLVDPVSKVRENASIMISELYNVYKGDEFEKKLMDKINSMKDCESYLIRNTVVHLCSEFYNSDKIFFNKRLLQIVLKLSKDKVSNVRMNSAILLKKISKINKSKEILKCLDDLNNDNDDDVVYAIMDN